MDITKVVIGTRSSELAMWQANWIKSLIETQEIENQVVVEILKIKTLGDKILDVPLNKIGGKGLFVKEIEEAIMRKEADIAVHSMKDVPMKLPYELSIGAITERESPFDALISTSGQTLDTLPKGSRIGTSSLRRSSQLLAYRPDFEIKQLRGNINTRLAKLEAGEFDAIILAAAGLHRMGWNDKITELISPDVILPAMGQGAVGIENRTYDMDIQAIVGRLDHEETHLTVEAERAFVQYLEGGCQVPIGAYATLDGDELTLKGLVASLDGKTIIRSQITGPSYEARKMGFDLGEEIYENGGGVILKELLQN
ncbi:MAG: hydroxymethylbilane synthase [Candidatus Nitrohelix vancouverensis]|uniref:Porphobilinogen deaminase n=1 Tax=Candidatus Nitrohelix vancouverensis TaxID=2705534 RepID=A0A7T0C3J9_9BACT|nr:MAG: hydroxymethylbilane synthase [Candidatus Nitrohelix vancouverensis]